MGIIMSGLDHSQASIELREQLSFTKTKTADIIRTIRIYPGVQACVLISTCNRTELYISGSDQLNPGELLCRAAACEYGLYQNAFVTRSGTAAEEHLMKVAAGLCSRIWGEDQIITQVKGAIAIAREAGTTDPILETLFRSAVAAGKEVRSRIHLTALPTSAAGMAVELVKNKMGDLTGAKVIVIGNGEMGRLSAALLNSAGCHVSVTLRVYHHGETIVPQGCRAIPYDERLSHFNETDILVSATTSPHYTVTADDIKRLSKPPKIIVDLAIPRDVEPEIKNIPGICLYNIDDLGNFTKEHTVPKEVAEILQTHLDNFHRWLNYRQCLTSMDSLKQAITERIFLSREFSEELGTEEIAEMSVAKTVDLLMGGLAENVTADCLARCESKIRAHTIERS